MRQPLEQQIIPLLKRINESLRSPREVVTLSYENGIRSKLVVHERWRGRFRRTNEAGSRHGNGPKDIRKANVHRKRRVAGGRIAGAHLDALRHHRRRPSGHHHGGGAGRAERPGVVTEAAGGHGGG